MPGHKPTAKQIANLKPIKKGEVRNPEGGRTHDPIARAIRKLTSIEVSTLISKIQGATLAELRLVPKNPSATVLEVWIASIAVKGIEKGDPHALDKILERAIGKVRQEVALGDPHGNALPPAEVHLHIPSNGKEAK